MGNLASGPPGFDLSLEAGHADECDSLPAAGLTSRPYASSHAYSCDKILWSGPELIAAVACHSVAKRFPCICKRFLGLSSSRF